MIAPQKNERSVPGGERAVTRELIAGFVGLAFVAVIVCVVLMVTLLRVGEKLDRVREDGRTVQEGLGLAISVREHYVHEAHTVIRGDRGEVDTHQAWIEGLRERVADLTTRVPEGERDRLDHLLEASEELDRTFIDEVVPAAMAGDRERLQRSHHRAEHLTEEATEDADALVYALERRMDRARHEAERASDIAMITGCAGLGTMFLIVLGVSFRINRSIVRPLQTLAEAARRLGDGEELQPLSPLGRGEIATVALAFDAMAQGIREREQLLVASERMAAIGQLAAGVAHEINNPVGIIRGYLQTMIREADSANIREELLILDEEAEACQRIVEDLLAYARAPHLELESLEMETVLTDAADRLRASQQVGPIRVDAATAELVVDPVRVRQVVTNLLRNAGEASTGAGEVELLGETGPNGYRITVLDRGPGISAGERERVFEPFRSDKSGGTGLGLAVCHSIVRAHGGTIVARDREGGGTKMIVELPSAPVGHQEP